MELSDIKNDQEQEKVEKDNDKEDVSEDQKESKQKALMIKVIEPGVLVKMKEFKGILIVDINDKARRVFCEICSKSLVSRKNECLEHITSTLHNKMKNKKELKKDAVTLIII